MKSKAQAFLDTLELRRGSVILPGEVNALKRRWNPHRNHMQNIDRYTEYEAMQAHGPYQVSAEATAVGLAWWCKQVFTPRGEVRKTKFMVDECAHVDVALPFILKNFSHFMLTDWEFVVSGSTDWMFPTYTIYGADNAAVDFVARPWQAGGNYIL